MDVSTPVARTAARRRAAGLADLCGDQRRPGAAGVRRAAVRLALHTLAWMDAGALGAASGAGGLDVRPGDLATSQGPPGGENKEQRIKNKHPRTMNICSLF